MRLLIDVGGLRERLDDVTVLDVRYRLGGPSARPDYQAGHIPGARFVELDADLAEPPGEHGRHPVPTAEHFQQAMRRLDVRPGRPVVVYDFADGTWAAPAWWLLRYFGHEDVAVLDGGYAAWTAGHLPTTTVEPEASDSDFIARPGGVRVVDADTAARLARSGMLLDARAAARYAGEDEPVDPVAGHIPGAVSAPTLANVDATGRFHSPEALRRRFDEMGVTDGTEVGVYCGSGVTAAHEALAIELAGLPLPALYADSWSGWITDASRLIATGPRPG